MISESNKNIISLHRLWFSSLFPFKKEPVVKWFCKILLLLLFDSQRSCKCEKVVNNVNKRDKK